MADTVQSPSSLARDPAYQALLTKLRETTIRHRVARSMWDSGNKLLPTNFEKQHPFPTALDLFRVDDGVHEGFPCYTLFEIKIMEILSEIKEKPKWFEKIYDAEIWGKWMDELKEGLAGFCKERKVAFDAKTEKSLRDALKWEAEVGRKRPGGPFEEMIECVFKSDDLIPNDLRQRLIAGVRPLENVPEPLKDWHPNSNKQVLDLVHPSLFPLVYNTTRVVSEPIGLADAFNHFGKGSPIPPPDSFHVVHDDSGTEVTSQRFQWLPTEFSINEQTGKVKALGYINNLHPVLHSELYGVVEEVFAKAVPVLDAVLTAVINETREYIKPGYSHWKNVDKKVYLAEEEEFRNEEDEYMFEEEDEDEEEEDGDEEDEDEKDGEDEEDKMKVDDEEKEKGDKEDKMKVDDEKKEKDNDTKEEKDDNKADADDSSEESGSDYDRPRIFRGPKIAPFKPAEYKTHVNLAKFGRLQAIIKFANIELTPENPTYSGGVWHVEGATNEAIVASALFYYSSDNISGGHLAFRHTVRAPNYDQNDTRGVELAYGLDESTGTVQELGSVGTPEGRLLAFPNLYQHCLGSDIKLTDPTKPGSRKLMAIFLVDPFNPIPSTCDVPPQQREWWSEELWKSQNKVSALPREVFDSIQQNVVEPRDLKWAKEIREELMKERGAKVEGMEQIFKKEFSLCEH